MANNRATEINTYLNEQEKNALQLSQESVIINALSHAHSEHVEESSAQLDHSHHHPQRKYGI